jgi:hypothetical protein
MACWKALSLAAALAALSAPSLAASQPCKVGDASCTPAQAEARTAQRAAADQQLKTADGDRGERARLAYREAASRYLVLWQTHFADPCRGGEPSCSHAEEVLYNASRAFRAAHELERASEVNGTLLDPQFRLHDTELAKKTLRDEGFVQQALTEYAKAASFYERFAKAVPKDEHAPEALLDAVVLRLGLHEQPAAEQNAELWTKLYAAKSPANHAKLVVAMAESKRDAGASPRELEAYLSKNRAVVAKAQSEHQPAVDVMLGTAVASGGDLAAARPHFERAAAFKVLPLIKRLQSEEQSIADRRLAKALIGIADAHLWLADRARDEAMKLTLLKSDPDSLKKKREAVTVAEKQYTKVLAVQPMPPPIATVEAAARVARMRGQLWAKAHLAYGPETADPMLAEAKAAYMSCVDLGAKYQAQTPASAACAKWLGRHYPKEHRVLTEIMPRAKWSSARFPMPPPLDENGEEP